MLPFFIASDHLTYAAAEPRPSVTVLFLAGPTKAGPARTVPGRRPGTIYMEADRVDDEATIHRRPEE
jgi:hypothetical protein